MSDEPKLRGKTAEVDHIDEAAVGGDNVVNLSKTRAKRLMNAQLVRDRTRIKELERDKGELQSFKKHLANALALLEATVKRYGPQVFDRETVEQECGGGRVALEITDKKITLRLKDDA